MRVCVLWEGRPSPPGTAPPLPSTHTRTHLHPHTTLLELSSNEHYVALRKVKQSRTSVSHRCCSPLLLAALLAAGLHLRKHHLRGIDEHLPAQEGGAVQVRDRGPGVTGIPERNLRRALGRSVVRVNVGNVAAVLTEEVLDLLPAHLVREVAHKHRAVGVVGGTGAASPTLAAPAAAVSLAAAAAPAAAPAGSVAAAATPAALVRGRAAASLAAQVAVVLVLAHEHLPALQILVVHLQHRIRSLLRSGELDDAAAGAATVAVLLDVSAHDVAARLEEVLQLLPPHAVRQVADVQATRHCHHLATVLDRDGDAGVLNRNVVGDVRLGIVGVGHLEGGTGRRWLKSQ
eukprot:Rhum_TRINITY_DN14833_c13_g1::Rhum_TRINITY_DN14833_c13_g1_i5::g.124576::m.124576